MENRLDREENRNNIEDQEDEEEDEEQPKTILGTFTREQFIMLCVGVGLVILLLAITIPAVLLSQSSSVPPSPVKVPSSSDGDMLDFLIKNGKIPEKDGLLATWYHSANNKSQLSDALKSPVMVLEADVNVRGHGTPNETNIPIMAHPPDVDSDNTLNEWMDAVLNSDKGIKLDFKSIESVEPSLDILRVKNQSVPINRPVWLNADIIHGPNVPSLIPVVDPTRFLQLIQQKYPEVTISPGWKVLYVPQLPNRTYTGAMMMDMYDAIRHVPQKVTFPVMAVLAKKAWPHISWLLSQSSRFSLTLWQGKVNPTLNDLLFIRDNSNPQRIYYDIYEPVLSQFKEAAKQRNRPRRFYPGGDLIDYFRPKKNDGLNIEWHTVASRDHLLSILQDKSKGMLVLLVKASRVDPKTPVVTSSGPAGELPLRECLDLLLASPKPWGIYLQVSAHSLLAPALRLLSKAYDEDRLYHPTWVSMAVSHGAFWTPGYISGEDFLRTVEETFPYVTLAPAWPRESLAKGYTSAVVADMLQLFGKAYQGVSLQLDIEALGVQDTGVQLLHEVQKSFSLTVQVHPDSDPITCLQHIRALQLRNKQQVFVNVPSDYRPDDSNSEDNF